MTRLAKTLALTVLLASVGVHLNASAATDTITVKVLVPVGTLANGARPPLGASSGGTAGMNCGWHTSCISPYPDGAGVDWDDEDGDGRTCCTGREVHFDVVAYRTMSGIIWVAEAELFYFDSASCHEVHARIDRYEGGTRVGAMGSVIYAHTTRDGPVSVDIDADQGGKPTGDRAGIMVSSEKSGCNWTRVHVHEGHSNNLGSWTRNVGAPPDAIRGADDCGSSNLARV